MFSSCATFEEKELTLYLFFSDPFPRFSRIIVNLIFVNILKNEKCATERKKCCRRNLKHKTSKKNFKKISKEMPWTGFEIVLHAWDRQIVDIGTVYSFQECDNCEH